MLPLWWRRLRSSRSETRADRSKSARTSLTLESLEAREVPAATLVSDAFDPNVLLSSTTANGQSEITPRNSISDDGKSIVFVSTAYNLIENQTRFAGTTITQNVYLYNNDPNSADFGKSTLITHNAGTATQNGNAASFNPVISGDGKTVAFYSYATDLMTGVSITSGTVQLYLYDNDPGSAGFGTLKLVTHTSGSTATGSDAISPFIPDTPSNSYNAVNTLGYSAGIDLGVQIVGGGLALPSLSADGKYVAFISNGTDMGFNVPADDFFGDHGTQVFLYDVAQDQLILVSHKFGDAFTGGASIVDIGFGPTNVGAYSSTVAISRDGSTVAFTTPFNNMLNGVAVDGSNDNLYVWSRIDNTTGATGLAAGATVLATHVAGNAGDDATIDAGPFLYGFTADTPPTLSDDGAFVAYYHAGQDLVSGQGGGSGPLNVFRYDVKNNTNLLVTHTGDGATAGDNPDNGVAPFGVGPAEATGPQISGDGRYIAYANNSSNLLGSAHTFSGYDGRDQVYLFDANTGTYGTNTLVSHAAGDVYAPNANGATAPSMSADGRYVAYIDWAYPDYDTASAGSVSSANAAARLYDRDASDPTVIPTALGNALSSSVDAEINAGILAPTVMNRNATFIAWDGSATDTVANDTNGALDVFLAANAPPAPTNLTLSTLDVPVLNDTKIGQFVTTADGTGRTFQYTVEMVNGGTPADPAQFVVKNGDELWTGSQFVTQITSDPTIIARTTDADYPTVYFEKQFTLNLIQAPTDITPSTATAPALPNAQVATLTTTTVESGRTFQYTLVSVNGGANNGRFALDADTGELTTGANISSAGGTYQLVVRSADAQFSGLFVEKTITVTTVGAPTNVLLDNDTIVPAPDRIVGTLSVPSSSRTYDYTLQDDATYPDNLLFTINGDDLTTASSFPATAPTSYTIQVRATDHEFPDLYFDKVLTVYTVNVPAQPTLNLPSSISGFEGQTAVLNISAGPGAVDPNVTVSVTISDVPAGVTFSAGTNNGNGSWTFTLAQLTGLTMTVPDNTSFTLQVVATASFISGGSGSSQTSGSLPVSIQNTVPAVSVSAPTQFNPLDGAVSVTVGVTDPGTDTIQAVIVNWGDGTADTFTGPGTFAHLYAVADETYPVTVSVVDEDGTFGALGGVFVDAELPTAQQGVVAELYLDLLGRSADAAGLAGWSSLLTAGVPLATVIQGIVSSPEYQTKVINDLYLKYLGRPADPDGLLAHLPILATGGPNAVAAILIGSQEFFDKAGGTNEAFVRAVYLAVLGREADPLGLQGYLDALNFGVPRAQIAQIVLTSTEAARAAVADAYETYLGRPADEVGIQAWLPLYLLNQTTFLVAFLSTPEFSTNAVAG